MDERLRVEHRVQRLGRKDEREGLSSALAADRWRTVDFWNLALYTVILRRYFPVLSTGRVGIYMIRGRRETAEQSKNAKRVNLNYLVPGAERSTGEI